jgi:hypothetical protein
VTRSTGASRVTPPSSPVDDDAAASGGGVVADVPGEEMTITYDELLSFNRAERRVLASKFDAEFMDLHRYIMQALGGGPPQASEDDNGLPLAPIVKIVTVEGDRVAVDDILIEMLLIIRRRTDPGVPDDAFDHISMLDLVGMLGAPKAGV